MRLRVIATVLVLCGFSVLNSSRAEAGCFRSGGSHFPGMKEISAELTVQNTDRCSVSRRPCGHCSVTSMSIVSRPRSGKLIASGLKAIYVRRPDFTGSDSFTLRWCETPMAEKGCYLAHYSVQVR
jgi:hypothetical protein